MEMPLGTASNRCGEEKPLEMVLAVVVPIVGPGTRTYH